ncbi:copper resistance protein B [Croceicoccus sp. BE223]|uniref:copper resistance protein B n=1 Tax=Croceicoccus sp. BE223 TaxID=2817716 RepID=UPI0028671E94|nr:copper resistance protein B [Croceicoccus sp. BE223]MDR7101603.1 copper resistance protein B [Croceicoccus sp. BE223]
MRALLLAAAATVAFAAPAMAQDHSHGEAAPTEEAGQPDPAPDATGHEGMDHSTMDHSTMDHSTMDHSTMDHSTMDHSSMDMSDPADPAMDGMDHSGMDHSGMDHSVHGASGPAVPDQPGNAPPPPVPTDHAADAVFGAEVMANSRDELLREMAFRGLVIGMDALEYRAGKGGDGYMFEGEGWYGGDIDRAVVAWSGEGRFGESPETIELAGYWRHAINPWFNLQLGARHDFRPDPKRTYALVGIQGLAPYWIEVEAQAFVSDKGDVHLRGTAAHDMRLTQRLVFEPEVELDFALQDVPELGIGSGLDTVELSGRLRYEIQRNFAPYVGVAWERKVGDSADFAREEGEDPSRVMFLAGLRFWF